MKIKIETTLLWDLLHELYWIPVFGKYGFSWLVWTITWSKDER